MFVMPNKWCQSNLIENETCLLPKLLLIIVITIIYDEDDDNDCDNHFY